MSINPEIRRYYWLDFSMHRLVLMPVVLGAIFLLYHLVGKTSTTVSGTITCYFVLVFLWGSYRASGAVIEEINANTWDYQRLSSMSPWSLSWAKVFGSTLYIWYGALISLGVFVFTASGTLEFPVILQTVLTLLIAGAFCISFVLLVGMQALQTSDRSSKRRIMGYRLLGLLIGVFVINITNAILPIHRSTYSWITGNLSLENKDIQTIIYFYGEGFRIDTFILMSLLVFFFWALFGVYRSMRTELQMQTTPLGWMCFLLFLFFYFGGISTQIVPSWSGGKIEISSWMIGPINMHQLFASAFVISIFSCYLMFFSDHLSIIRYRMLHHHFSTGNMSKAGQLVPRWAISYIFAVISGIVLINTQPSIKFYNEFVSAAIGLTSLLLFLLRDIGILHYFSLAPDNRRAFMATMFYLFILYILLPSLLAAMRLKTGGLFYPIIGITQWTHLIPILVQVIIVGYLVFRRWQSADVPEERIKKE